MVLLTLIILLPVISPFSITKYIYAKYAQGEKSIHNKSNNEKGNDKGDDSDY
ncbi:MAG TPA: hypothetical protein VJS91_02995 [Nitrososphaeraceae archaeon]|nr:hypothetical protein [Nitrososphaeraceae archaeon]